MATAARIFRNLLRLSSFPPPRFLIYRNQSSARCKNNPIDQDDLDLESDPLDHVMAVRMIESAMHQIPIGKCIPGWLPFVPGGSYWVPPIGSSESSNVAEMVEKLASSLKKEEMVARRVNRLVRTEGGWPSKAYF